MFVLSVLYSTGKKGKELGRSGHRTTDKVQRYREKYLGGGEIFHTLSYHIKTTTYFNLCGSSSDGAFK